jgi:hypothetical protein
VVWRILRRFLRAAFARRHETGPLFAVIVTLVYAVVIGRSLLHHDMWRDEVSCWNIGKNASGLLELLTGERRYEGHPFLWYYFLHVISKVWKDVRIIQIAAFCLSTGTAFLWMRYAPVPRLLRVLLLGSYLVVYEYSVISRSYTLGLFLLAVFCALYDPRRLRFLPLAITLGVLSATSVYGFIFALCLAIPTFLPYLRVLRTAGEPQRVGVVAPRGWVTALLVLWAALVLTTVTTLPPEDEYFAPTWNLDFADDALHRAGERIWNGVVALPSWEPRFWNSNWLTGTPALRHWAPWGATVILALWFLALVRRPWVALTFGTGVALMAFFQHAKYSGDVRHQGHYFLLIMACVWIYAKQQPRRRLALPLQVVFALTLVPQLAGGYLATKFGLTETFSTAKQTADFIRSHGLAGRPIVGLHDHHASAVAGYLDVPMLFMDTGEYARSVVFHNRRHGFGAADVVEAARSLRQKTGIDPIIVSNTDYGALKGKDLVIKKVFSPKLSIVGDETFVVYTVSDH